MSLKYQSNIFTVGMKLIKPAADVKTSNYPARYTWVFDRETVAAMKTNALATLAGLAGLTSNPPPYITYSPTTQLETLYAYPMSLYNLGTSLENINTCALIGWNASAIDLWRGWPSTRVDPPEGPTKKFGWFMNVMTDGTNYLGAPQADGNINPPDQTTTLIAFPQSWPNNQMPCCSSIEIESTLPSLPEYTDAAPLDGVTVQNTNAPILTDLFIDFSQNGNGYQSTSIYTATGLAGTRWIKLTGKSPITTFSISLWWIDRAGVRRPLPILYERCSIKLAFAHKSIIENYILNPTDLPGRSLRDSATQAVGMRDVVTQSDERITDPSLLVPYFTDSEARGVLTGTDTPDSVAKKRAPRKPKKVSDFF